MFKKIWKYLAALIVGILSVLTFILIPKKKTNDEIVSLDDKIDIILGDKEVIKSDIKTVEDKIEKLKKIKIGNDKEQLSINEAIDFLHKIGKNEKTN